MKVAVLSLYDSHPNCVRPSCSNLKKKIVSISLIIDINNIINFNNAFIIFNLTNLTFEVLNASLSRIKTKFREIR